MDINVNKKKGTKAEYTKKVNKGYRKIVNLTDG